MSSPSVLKKRKSGDSASLRAPKKGRSQYVIFKDLVKGTEEGKKMTGSDLTKFVKEKSTMCKSIYYKTEDPCVALWNEAAAKETTEAADYMANLKTFASGKLKEAEEGLASATQSAAAETPASLRELDNALLTAASCMPLAQVHGLPLVQLQDAMAIGRAKAASCKTDCAGREGSVLLEKMRAALDANTTAALQQVVDEHLGFERMFVKHAQVDLLKDLAALKGQAEAALKTLSDEVSDAAMLKRIAEAAGDENKARAIAVEHRELNETVAELEEEVKELRMLKARADAVAEEQERKAQGVAYSLPGQIAKNMNSQMVYYKGLKYSSKVISYTTGGVTQAIFDKAFSAGGRTTLEVEGYSLGIRGKSLRYGAMTHLIKPVTLTLKGDTFTAKSAYSM